MIEVQKKGIHAQDNWEYIAEENEELEENRKEDSSNMQRTSAGKTSF